MKNDDKITLTEWNELADEEKEQIRIWAVKHGYELELVPGSSGTFDPICEYAALLTSNQMIGFLKEHNQSIPDIEIYKQSCNLLWKRIVKYLRH